MLLSRIPLAIVHPAIRPNQLALAVLPSAIKMSLIPAAVGPTHGALRPHLIPPPLPDIAAAVGPPVRALAMHVVIVELALESAPIGPSELAPSMPVLATELPLKDGAVWKLRFFFWRGQGMTRKASAMARPRGVFLCCTAEACTSQRKQQRPLKRAPRGRCHRDHELHIRCKRSRVQVALLGAPKQAAVLQPTRLRNPAPRRKRREHGRHRGQEGRRCRRARCTAAPSRSRERSSTDGRR
mmetsp:Transcript_115290/g.321232  ORF Transcript_115290/g.321232 Transcript_115290/m.321232 type:complete len:240 (-) Transcript_115290:1431-2150(-)